MSGRDRSKWNRRYREGAYSLRPGPSALLENWVGRIPPGRALDVACGAGRNALYLAAQGFQVDAVDISAEGLQRARASAQHAGLCINWMERDLDEPLRLEHRYQLILIVRYVNLPLVRRLAGHLAPGGYLICEQHLVSDADVIGPANPAFRVKPGELQEAAGELQILQLEEALVRDPDGSTAALGRLVARNA